jgi:hypothetical protein
LLLPLVLMVAGAMFLQFLHTIVFMHREAEYRACCSNRLKAIALAMHQYHDDYGCFPPAHISGKDGQPKVSWRVLILPYLAEDRPNGPELRSLYNAYRFDEPWDGPNNRKLAERMPQVFGCPNDPEWRHSHVNYLAITGPGTLFPDAHSTKLGDIVDGPDRTAMFIEVGNTGINWLQPIDLAIDKINLASPPNTTMMVLGNHQGGGQLVPADGSVIFVHRERVTKQLLSGLATIAGGEPIDRDKFP